MRVEQAMSEPAVTVTPDAPVKAAAALMAAHGYTVLPVVNGDLELVGVVSEGDVVRDRIPPHPMMCAEPAREPAAPTVGEIMTTDVVAADSHEDVRSLVRRMREARVRSVPVRRHGSVVGVVSLHDIVEMVARADERIAADVRHHLDIYARPGQFDVHVRDGEAVLIDSVGDRRQWHTVRVLAEQVAGVQRARVVTVADQAPVPAGQHPAARWWAD